MWRGDSGEVVPSPKLPMLSKRALSTQALLLQSKNLKPSFPLNTMELSSWIREVLVFVIWTVVALEIPFMSNKALGSAVPIPTLPESSITKAVVPEEDAVKMSALLSSWSMVKAALP